MPPTDDQFTDIIDAIAADVPVRYRDPHWVLWLAVGTVLWTFAVSLAAVGLRLAWLAWHLHG
jgi:hypothetical protein